MPLPEALRSLVSLMAEALISRIPVRARLRGRLSGLAGVLRSYPWLVQTGKGSSLRYRIGEDRQDCSYEVEFSADRILLTVHSKASPAYHMQEAMLRILSICSSLEGLYEPDIRSLYPYLINLLASGQFGQMTETHEPVQDVEWGEGITLARRINGLAAENARLAAQVEKGGLRFNMLLFRFLLARRGGQPDIGTACAEAGVGREEVEAALRNAGDFGYRSIRIGDRFSLVRM